ncbi:hypothetical protein MA16_Dca008982 [Dendrobium catenatum]|uniref:Uncharacterized protein n=1 Tax=Dendrobium catenatum TaxID=906689 RepID=A0A2I0VR65_9ASPA|nr:hypothetical protein MA16_Dca008982 [Dendrobium catenatum]
MQTKVAEEAGRRSTNGRRRHHERSSSPKKPPGPSMQVATIPLLSCWLLCKVPLTINTMRFTGSPSLITWFKVSFREGLQKNYLFCDIMSISVFTFSFLEKTSGSTRSHMLSRIRSSRL